VTNTHELRDHSPVNISQPEITPGVAVRKLIVVEPQQIENQGVEAMDVNPVDGGGEAKLVGGAMDVTNASAVAGKPH
jgi:hypothetical protein